MHRRAVVHLRKADPVLGQVLDQVGPYRFKTYSEGTHFHFLARSIVYQQLSGKAAATIFGRVLQLDGGPFLRPERLLDIPIEQLRTAGLSRQKASYVKGMAEFVADGNVSIERLHEMSDSEVCDQLVRMNGVGIWTAQMFLIFRLGRKDVLPATDLGVRKGVQLAYKLRKMPDPARVEKIGSRWAPFRSVASWYLWRLLDLKAARRKSANGK